MRREANPSGAEPIEVQIPGVKSQKQTHLNHSTSALISTEQSHFIEENLRICLIEADEKDAAMLYRHSADNCGRLGFLDLRALVGGDKARQQSRTSRGLRGRGRRGAWRRDDRVRTADGGSAGISAAGTQLHQSQHQSSEGEPLYATN